MLTDDPNDPRLGHYTGPEKPGPQADVYLVLPEAERAKGFVRPVIFAVRIVDDKTAAELARKEGGRACDS